MSYHNSFTPKGREERSAEESQYGIVERTIFCCLLTKSATGNCLNFVKFCIHVTINIYYSCINYYSINNTCLKWCPLSKCRLDPNFVEFIFSVSLHVLCLFLLFLHLLRISACVHVLTDDSHVKLSEHYFLFCLGRLADFHFGPSTRWSSLRSPIWDFYVKYPDMSVCKTCGSVLRGSRINSNAKYHLKALHPELFDIFQEKRGEWLCRRKMRLNPSLVTLKKN